MDSINSPNDGKKRGKSKLEKIPEKDRKKILIFIVSFITLTLIFLWASNFSSSIKTVSKNEGEEDLSELFKQTQQTLDQIKQEVDKLDQVGELIQSIPVTSPTTSPEISAEDIEKIKEKLTEQQ